VFLGILSGTLGVIGILWLALVLSNDIQASFMAWSGLPLPSDPYLEMVSFVILGGLLNFVQLNPFQIYLLTAAAWGAGGIFVGFTARNAMRGIIGAIGITLIICSLGAVLVFLNSPVFIINLLVPYLAQAGPACAIAALTATITGGIAGQIGDKTEV
jgi:hypothetical protein